MRVISNKGLPAFASCSSGGFVVGDFGSLVILVDCSFSSKPLAPLVPFVAVGLGDVVSLALSAMLLFLF